MFPGDLQKHIKNCHQKTSLMDYRHDTEMKITFHFQQTVDSGCHALPPPLVLPILGASHME